MWPCNLDAVAVFRACEIGAVGTMAGLYWTGIAAVELRAALVLLRIARGDWTDLADDVRYMGSEVAAERNRRAQSSARRRKNG